MDTDKPVLARLRPKLHTELHLRKHKTGRSINDTINNAVNFYTDGGLDFLEQVKSLSRVTARVFYEQNNIENAKQHERLADMALHFIRVLNMRKGEER